MKYLLDNVNIRKIYRMRNRYLLMTNIKGRNTFSDTMKYTSKLFKCLMQTGIVINFTFLAVVQSATIFVD